MQGLVFTYRKKRTRRSEKLREKAPEIKKALAKWGAVMFFSAALAGGLLCGCLTAGGLKPDTLKNLDFFFTTNLPDRLSGGALNAFTASFGSGFLFLLSAFLLGLSLWGAAAMPFVAFFKGYGVGVSAGYLLMTYGLKGLVFYLTALLPGIVVFSMALIYELGSAYHMYLKILKSLFSKACGSFFKDALREYSRRSLRYLAASLAAALIDTALWACLAGLFF